MTRFAFTGRRGLIALVILANGFVGSSFAQQEPVGGPPAAVEKKADAPAASPAKTEGEKKDEADSATIKFPGFIPLQPRGLWVDLKRKWVMVDGRVCLRRGGLEMFACPKGTKEHESIVAIDHPSFFVHAALLRVGLAPGKTVRFNPYEPAKGPALNIYILWIDKTGKKRVARAQEWVRNFETKKALEHDFIFTGSRIWTEKVDNKTVSHYEGNAGDFICVSNFPSATIDLPVKSSQANNALIHEAFTERIPTVGTRVRLVLIPKASKEKADGTAAKKEKSQ